MFKRLGWGWHVTSLLIVIDWCFVLIEYDIFEAKRVLEQHLHADQLIGRYMHHFSFEDNAKAPWKRSIRSLQACYFTPTWLKEVIPSLLGRSCCEGWVGGGADKLDIPRFLRRMNPGCNRTTAAYRCLHLISELLVQQSVYKRVDSRIEQDHCVSNGDWYRTNVVGCKRPKGVDNWAHTPADSKYNTHCYDHQGDPLS